MRRRIPSTAALTAFESAARHQSFTKAADELAVTQSAVCRQIAALEDFLGVKLFRRGARGVFLTEAGVTYCRQIAARLDEVERDTLSLMTKGDDGGTLELAVVPTFATRWLLPRLPSFNALHPGITVNFSAQTRPFLFHETAFDAAIYAGESVWPGTEGQFLLHEHLAAVCSPDLISARQAREPIEWSRYTLLQQNTRPYIWRNWLALHGIQIEGDMAGPRFELFSMLAEAASHGMGIALIPPFLIEDELRQGRLIQITTEMYRSNRSYYLILPEDKPRSAALGAFQGWLDEQAQRYRETA